ncbi:proteolipid protein 2b isoform X1 [Solea solea]|uniref:proteolipid protein 2b isoform X1 n=1 Tax=Solea solea TaxID=90069 RepID=UPI00272AFBE0|nr:proteolipid protein 2b isoform X1 [Solea solea]
MLSHKMDDSTELADITGMADLTDMADLTELSDITKMSDTAAITDTARPRFVVYSREQFKSYVKTPKGFILASETLLSLIILICYAASLYGGYSAVAICEMIFSMIFFGIFMMELDKQILVVNWLWTDLFRAGIGALLYIITSLICVIGGAGDGARIAGGVFGLIAGLLFAYDTYTIYMQIKSSRQHNPAPTHDSV